MLDKTPDLDVHDMVRQLTETHSHREPYSVLEGTTKYGRHHVITVPALVLQLVEASNDVLGSGSESGSAPVSKPAARIEALDTVMHIDDGVGEWIDRLGGVIPADRIDPKTQRTIPGSGTLLRLRVVHGLYPSTKTCTLGTAQGRHRKDDASGWCCNRGHLEHDVRRWWYQARILVGWDVDAWRPWNTCPVCDHRGGLRVRLDSALCVECRTVWAADKLGLLAEHIRAENRETPDEPERIDTCA